MRCVEWRFDLSFRPVVDSQRGPGGLGGRGTARQPTGLPATSFPVHGKCDATCTRPRFGSRKEGLTGLEVPLELVSFRGQVGSLADVQAAIAGAPTRAHLFSVQGCALCTGVRVVDSRCDSHRSGRRLWSITTKAQKTFFICWAAGS